MVFKALIVGRSRYASGFTLLELVMVAVIVAVFIVTALPKFRGVGAEARVSKLAGVSAALKSAAAMAHGQLLARGFPVSATITKAEMEAIAEERRITVEGTVVSFVNGYPAAAVIGEIAGVESPDFYLRTVGDTRLISTDGNRIGTIENPGCSVIYTEAEPGRQPKIQLQANAVRCE